MPPPTPTTPFAALRRVSRTPLASLPARRWYATINPEIEAKLQKREAREPMAGAMLRRQEQNIADQEASLAAVNQPLRWRTPSLITYIPPYSRPADRKPGLLKHLSAAVRRRPSSDPVSEWSIRDRLREGWAQWKFRDFDTKTYEGMVLGDKHQVADFLLDAERMWVDMHRNMATNDIEPIKSTLTNDLYETLNSKRSRIQGALTPDITFTWRLHPELTARMEDTKPTIVGVMSKELRVEKYTQQVCVRFRGFQSLEARDGKGRLVEGLGSHEKPEFVTEYWIFHKEITGESIAAGEKGPWQLGLQVYEDKKPDWFIL